MVLITPEKTSVLECTEASQTFSDKPVEGLETMADVYTMALDKQNLSELEQCLAAKMYMNSLPANNMTARVYGISDGRMGKIVRLWTERWEKKGYKQKKWRSTFDTNTNE